MHGHTDTTLYLHVGGILSILFLDACLFMNSPARPAISLSILFLDAWDAQALPLESLLATFNSLFRCMKHTLRGNHLRLRVSFNSLFRCMVYTCKHGSKFKHLSILFLDACRSLHRFYPSSSSFNSLFRCMADRSEFAAHVKVHAFNSLFRCMLVVVPEAPFTPFAFQFSF